MPSPEISATFFVTALLLGIAPGPDNIFVLTQSALYGTKAGLATTFGLVTGICFHTLAVALGVAALLVAYPLGFGILKCLGAFYLCWLAWLTVRSPASNPADMESSRAAFPGYMGMYRRGIILNITNPKVCLFFLAFLPQFCAPGPTSLAWQIIWFGALFAISTIIVFGAVACAGSALAKWLDRSAKRQKILHWITAAIFVALALGLLFADVA